jgi:predicted ribosomally synthesized peptide with SipW-like signal peptide
MSRTRLKQYLMLLLAIGVIAVAMTGSGTFASFNAETTNPGNTFVSGTLFLHNTANGGTTCKSESVTTGPNYNVNGGCDVLFSNVNLAGGAATAHLALNNAGSINSNDLTFKVGNCTVGTNPGTGSAVTFGSGPTCNNMYLTVQETQSDYSTNVYCAYGPSTTQPACDTPNNTATLGNSSSLTNLKTTAGANATLTSGQTRYYVITVLPSVTNDNTLQNRQVSFDMTWHIDS